MLLQGSPCAYVRQYHVHAAAPTTCQLTNIGCCLLLLLLPAALGGVPGALAVLPAL
jgi:hypothetical protein